jgi:hypothetical protein
MSLFIYLRLESRAAHNASVRLRVSRSEFDFVDESPRVGLGAL